MLQPLAQAIPGLPKRMKSGMLACPTVEAMKRGKNILFATRYGACACLLSFSVHFILSPGHGINGYLALLAALYSLVYDCLKKSVVFYSIEIGSLTILGYFSILAALSPDGNFDHHIFSAYATLISTVYLLAYDSVMMRQNDVKLVQP